MAKRVILWCCAVILVAMLCGCSTAKGIGTGIGCTIEGAGKDTATLWGGLVKLDNWIKKNLW